MEEAEIKVSIRSVETDEIQEIRNARAVLIAKRNRALTKFGEMALPALKDDPGFAEQAEQIEGYIREIGELDDRENELLNT